jgi:hypothetical protein
MISADGSCDKAQVEGFLLLDATSPVLHVEGLRTRPGIREDRRNHPVAPLAVLLCKCEGGGEGGMVGSDVPTQAALPNRGQGISSKYLVFLLKSLSNVKMNYIYFLLCH